jgi:uncharacterized protein (TIGR03435 family)
MARLAWMVGVLTVAILNLAGRSQAQDNALAFEIASVKHNTSATARLSVTRAPARFTVLGAPLTTVILMAHNIRASLARFVVEGLGTSGRACLADCDTRDEILSARFDITANVPAGTTATNDQQMLMLRRLLAERFKLKTRVEMRDIPVYALTVASPGRLGPQLRPSAYNCEAWQQTRRDNPQAAEPLDSRGRPACQSPPVTPGLITRRSAGAIAALLPQIDPELDRPVIDRTGLEGNLEWELTHESRAVRENPSLASFASKAPTIDVALQEQLGLRLVPVTAPFEVLIIESVQMPTPD